MNIGVLGGGQLGRMLGLAGIPLGGRFTFFDPSPESPAAAVGDLIVGSYDDEAALQHLCAQSDVVTYEFENVPVHAAEYVAQHRPVWPPVQTLHVAQDRISEKESFRALEIPTAPFARVDTIDDLHSAIARIGTPGILKTRRLGYDGKGQMRITSIEDAAGAWDAIGGVPLIYEGHVTFTRELSIIAVRAHDGTTAFYPLVENHHSEGILRRSIAPAPAVNDATRTCAEAYATRVMQALQYVGVLAIELFDTPDGLLANEMAPRVHNSGHWTIEGSVTSQFENHIRAVCQLPLGSTAMRGAATMLNVIGTLPSSADVLAIPDVHLHLYDKAPVPRRKLGHITVRADDAAVVNARIETVRRVLARG